MISPALRHRASIKAATSQQPSPAVPDQLGRSLARESRQKTSQQGGLMSVRLMDDSRQISTIRSRSARNAHKKTLIPHYLDHLTSVISRGRLAMESGDRYALGKADRVLTTVCIWCFDAEDYRHGLPLFEYIVEMQLPSPDNFKSSMAEIIVRTLADTVIRRNRRCQHSSGELLGIVEAVLELADGVDMADEVRANLYRAYASVNQGHNPALALSYYRQAVAINPGLGVKRVIDRLEKITGD